MKYRALVVGSLALALAAAPILSARAWYDRPYYYYGTPPVYYSNPLLWPFQAAAAVVVGAATLATLPFRVIAGATYPYPAYYGPPRYYYPPPGYYPPSSGYYPPPQGYSAPPGATITPR
ncbi:MAG TPA: hypothetical protein VJN67_09085 [Stellaceae bacterium]|nr:hypothetical protein [Stellaceae bacterium]